MFLEEESMDTTLQSVREATPVQSFSRRSSGLVRELSLTDAAWYGVLGSGGLFGYVFLFPGPQFASPGISIPLMLVANPLVRRDRVLRLCRLGLGDAAGRRRLPLRDAIAARCGRVHRAVGSGPHKT